MHGGLLTSMPLASLYKYLCFCSCFFTPKQLKSLLPSEQIGVRINIQDIKMTGRYFFSVILLICVATAAAQGLLCQYGLLTKTGIQEANATRGARVDLILNFGDEHQRTIFNISQYNVLDEHHESFQNDTYDAFSFDGPCEHYCDDAFVFHGTVDNYWNFESFTLLAYFSIGSHERTYHPNRTLHGPYDYYEFNFCEATEAVGPKKQELTGASLLRLVGMPAYTT